MTIYYVNHRNQNGLHPPLDGGDYADIEAVREECLVGAKQMIADRLNVGAPLSEILNQSYEVTDEGGNTVLLVSFADALEADIIKKLKKVVWTN